MADQLPLRFRPIGRIVNKAALLAACFGPLAAEAFPIASWTPEAMLQSFITVDLFVKKVKILTKETNPIIFSRLIHKGTADGWWRTPGTCTSEQVVYFCMWLRTKEGTPLFQTEARRLHGTKRKALQEAVMVQEETRPKIG